MTKKSKPFRSEYPKVQIIDNVHCYGEF